MEATPLHQVPKALYGLTRLTLQTYLLTRPAPPHQVRPLAHCSLSQHTGLITPTAGPALPSSPARLTGLSLLLSHLSRLKCHLLGGCSSFFLRLSLLFPTAELRLQS